MSFKRYLKSCFSISLVFLSLFIVSPWLISFPDNFTLIIGIINAVLTLPAIVYLYKWSIK